MFTTNQWAVVALVLLAGWLLGVMSRSSDGRWKTDYERERDAHLALRRDHDANVSRQPVVVERGVTNDREIAVDRSVAGDRIVTGDRIVSGDRTVSGDRIADRDRSVESDRPIIGDRRI